MTKKAQDMYATLDFDKMRERCLASIEDFYSLGTVFETKDGPYIFKDNGADILFVAHLDTVQPQSVNHFQVSRNFYEVTTWDNKGERNTRNSLSDIFVHSAFLDDRLGVYLILDYFSQYMKFDWLLCTNEERGGSTACYFNAPKQYNWMAEFDRGGQDAVHYQYEDAAWLKALRAGEFKMQYGSYSDIAELEHLNCCGVNVGVGYANYHSANAYASMNELLANIRRFASFYKANHKKAYAHDPAATKSTRAWGRWDEFNNDPEWNRYLSKYSGGTTTGSSTTNATYGIELCEICSDEITTGEDRVCYDAHKMCTECFLRVYEKNFDALEAEREPVGLVKGDWVWIEVPEKSRSAWIGIHEHSGDFDSYTGANFVRVNVELEDAKQKTRKRRVIIPIDWITKITGS